jgi:RHS repeat-associated protein
MPFAGVVAALSGMAGLDAPSAVARQGPPAGSPPLATGDGPGALIGSSPTSEGQRETGPTGPTGFPDGPAYCGYACCDEFTFCYDGPEGGPFYYGELAAGGDNESEFCVPCFLGRLISFILPVDAPTGNFWHTFDDLSVPGRGMALDLTRTYNSMSAATDGPFGFGWSFPYDMSLSFPDPTHVVVNQGNGAQVTFTEQSGGVYAAPPRVTATLVHNGDGSWTFVRRHKDTFSFDSGGLLTQEKDLNGYVTTLAHNGSGQLTTVTDPAGRKLTFAYSGNHISSVTDPLGRVVTYAYDGEGNLTDVTDVNGGNTHFTYDSGHRMLTMRFPDQAPGVPGSTGAVVSNKYDGQGRVIEQTDQLGRTTKFAYVGEPLTEAGGTTTITDPKGNVTVQEYHYGELLSETKGYGTPQAATWTFSYDPVTLGMTSVTDPDGHTTFSTFDSEGNTLTTTDALGRSTTNTYDALNDLLTTTDPLGVTTTNKYDAHGNLLSTSRPLSGTSEAQTTTYTYGDATHPGDVTAMTDSEGHTWKYAYDSDGDRTSTTDPLGNKSTSTYNTIGWVLSTTSPRGNTAGVKPASFTTTFAHNSFDQVTETVDPLGHKTTSQYDPDQNLIASTDADGNTTTYTYDAAGEQTAVHRADGTTMETAFGPDGEVTEQIDCAGHVTSYEYDPLGRESAVTDPLGRTTRYGYDLAGNRVTVTDSEGRVTTTAYDADNEQTSITYSDGKTPNVTGITYDADGERTGETDGSGTWSWTWDSLHRLTSVTEGNSGTVKYRYDLRGDPTTITYPDGHSVRRGYDAAGRWTSVTDWLGNTTTFSYDHDSNLTTETLPGSTGITDTSTYANDDTLSSISDTHGASTLFAANYTRDANRQLTGDSSQPGPEGGYAYNALNQLCYADSGTGSCTSPPTGATQYQYDSADNLTKMGVTAQTFDAADELTSTSTPSGGGEEEHEGKHEAGPEPTIAHNEPHAKIGVGGFHEERLLPTVTSGKVAFAHANGHGGVVSQLVSTTSAKDLLLAFVSARESQGGGQGVTGIKGGKLKWTAVTIGSFSGGYVSIWKAKAFQRLKHLRISVKLRRAGLPAALSVVGFDSGTSVVNAARASRRSGVTNISATVPADAAVWAVGQDGLRHAKLKPLPGQTIVTKINAPGSAISWLQTGAPPSAGRLVLGESAPKSSSWALGAVVIQERAGATGKAARRATAPALGDLMAGETALASPLGSGLRATGTAHPLAGSATETKTFSYNAEGDRLGLTTSAGASQTYSYNQALELTGVGSEASYTYNGDGLRMFKTVGVTTTPFTWDVASGLPSVLEDGTNAYIYGPGGLPLEQIAGTTPLWFHQDQLGDTRLLTSATGQTVAKYAYTPYGGLASSSGTASTPLLYAGQYRDNESGLYYLRARYYDPVTGQFLSVDPAVQSTLSPYAYGAGNPLNAADPSGQDPSGQTTCDQIQGYASTASAGSDGYLATNYSLIVENCQELAHCDVKTSCGQAVADYGNMQYQFDSERQVALKRYEADRSFDGPAYPAGLASESEGDYQDFSDNCVLAGAVADYAPSYYAGVTAVNNLEVMQNEAQREAQGEDKLDFWHLIFEALSSD